MWNNFLISLAIMGKGMAGIFVVVLIRILNVHLDIGSASVHRILDQLFNDRGRTLNHLSRRDLIGDMVRK